MNIFKLIRRISIFAFCFVFLLSHPLEVKASSFAIVILSDYNKTLNIGDEFLLTAISSDLSIPKFKSNNSSVASVNTYGVVTAKKSGSATITAKVKGGEARCRITVKKTTITLSSHSYSLEKGETVRLTAKSSTGHTVTYKSNRKSLATIVEYGRITAIKPGEATITATCDKTSVTCKITVKKPVIKLSKTSLTLKVGDKSRLIATASSGYPVTFKSSRKSIAIIDEYGNIQTLKAGTTVITAKLDGVEKTCILTVNEDSKKKKSKK